MAGQEPEELELPRGEAQRLPLLGHDARGGVDLEAVEGEPLLLRARRLGAPQHGADAGRELARRERLRHVVVGAELEPDDPVGLLASRGEHDHRELRAGADPPAQLEAVRSGQHQVEHDEVGPLGLDQLARAVAVGRLQGAVPSRFRYG